MIKQIGVLIFILFTLYNIINIFISGNKNIYSLKIHKHRIYEIKKLTWDNNENIYYILERKLKFSLLWMPIDRNIYLKKIIKLRKTLIKPKSNKKLLSESDITARLI